MAAANFVSERNCYDDSGCPDRVPAIGLPYVYESQRPTYRIQLRQRYGSKSAPGFILHVNVSGSPMSCIECLAGTYQPEQGASFCTQCPDGRTSPVGSTSQAQCTYDNMCSPGSTGPAGGPCTECEAGEHKRAKGSAPCDWCQMGTYSAKGMTECASCEAHSFSFGHDSGCTCNDGYERYGDGACERCQAGKYLRTTLSGACMACPSGTYSTVVGATSDVCQACPAGSEAPEASDEITDCVCQPGLSGPAGGPCTPCVAGTYKVATGLGACDACPSGTYATAVGATSNVKACPAETEAPEASDNITDCACRPGMTGPDGGPCTPCVAGTYKVAAGLHTCSACSAGKYSAAVGATSNVCRACPSNSDAAEASTVENVMSALLGPTQDHAQRVSEARTKHTPGPGRVLRAHLESTQVRVHLCALTVPQTTTQTRLAAQRVCHAQHTGRRLRVVSTIQTVCADLDSRELMTM